MHPLGDDFVEFYYKNHFAEYLWIFFMAMVSESILHYHFRFKIVADQFVKLSSLLFITGFFIVFYFVNQNARY